MRDAALRSLERAAADGDPHAELRLYRARLRVGKFGADAPRVAQALDVACEGDGEPDEAILEVLGFALSGELAHGSWVTFYGPDSAVLANHGSGTWFCVLYWYQGQHARDCPDLRWLEHWAVCPAGRPMDVNRRGHNKCVSNWRWGALTYGLRDGLHFLASYLDTTYKPRRGLALWQARKQLAASRGNVTRLVRAHHVGPRALSKLNAAQAKAEEIEIQIKTLEGGK